MLLPLIKHATIASQNRYNSSNNLIGCTRLKLSKMSNHQSFNNWFIRRRAFIEIWVLWPFTIKFANILLGSSIPDECVPFIEWAASNRTIAQISGITTGQTLQLARRRKVVPTFEKTILARYFRFFFALLSEIDLGNADTREAQCNM